MSKRMRSGTTESAAELVDAAVRGELDQAQTLRLCTECPEIVTLALRISIGAINALP